MAVFLGWKTGMTYSDKSTHFRNECSPSRPCCRESKFMFSSSSAAFGSQSFIRRPLISVSPGLSAGSFVCSGSGGRRGSMRRETYPVHALPGFLNAFRRAEIRRNGDVYHTILIQHSAVCVSDFDPGCGRFHAVLVELHVFFIEEFLHTTFPL